MSKSPLHSVSVAGVVFDQDGRVLLIRRRDNGQWQAPGGVLEVDEKFEDGVVREVFEETGVSVAVEELTGVYKNMNLGVVALVYRCTPLSGFPCTSDEAVDVMWVPYREALSRMNSAFAVRVSDAHNVSSEGVASRAHDGQSIVR